MRRELLHPGLVIGRGVRPAGRPGQITGHILARVAVHLSSVSSCVVVASCVSAVFSSGKFLALDPVARSLLFNN